MIFYLNDFIFGNVLINWIKKKIYIRLDLIDFRLGEVVFG